MKVKVVVSTTISLVKFFTGVRERLEALEKLVPWEEILDKAKTAYAIKQAAESVLESLASDPTKPL